MGCCSSSEAVPPAPATANSPYQPPKTTTASAGSIKSKEEEEELKEKGLTHTNSMLFSKQSLAEVKKSLKLEQPIAEGKPGEFNPEDPHGILTPSTVNYELGSGVIYAADMTSSQTVTLKHDNDKTRPLVFGYKTLQGRAAIAPSKPNQDSLVVIRVEGKEDWVVFGVFDGHGPFGDHASHYCRMMFHQTLKRVMKDLGDTAQPQDILEATITHIHESFINSEPSSTGIDPQVSGTTLIVAMIIENMIYVANVGDSRCIAGYQNDDESVEVEPLSDDHKPERESERARLEKTEAVLLSEGQLRGGSRNEGKTYICRKKNGEIIYGVLFTRSIGDLDAHQYLGVSAEPEFKVSTIEEGRNHYLILASDGIWDQISNEEVVQIVFSKNDPLAASEEIAAVAKHRWDNDKTHSRRDDITVCCVKLN